MKIALFGTFDVPNYGDCEFPIIVNHFLRERLNAPLLLDLYSPTDHVARIADFPRVAAVPNHLGDRLETTYDAFLLAGGDNLVSGHSISGVYCMLRPGTLTAGLRRWLYPAMESARQEAHWAVHSVGARSMDPDVATGLQHALQSASHLTVRDPYSHAKLAALDIEASTVTDIGFGIPDTLSTHEWRSCFERVVPSALSPGSYIVAQASRGYIQDNEQAFVRAVADIARSLGKQLLFLPICRHLCDQNTVSRLYRQSCLVHNRSLLLTDRLTTRQTAALLAHSAGFVGTSMHAAITALAFERPAALLVRELPGKHDGTLSAAGYDGLCTQSPDELAACFSHARHLDLHKKAALASNAVASGFDTLLRTLHTVPPHRAEHSLLESLTVAADADITSFPRGPVARMKRFAFSMVRSHESLLELYEASRHMLRWRHG